jgi:hypothetical protein
MSQPLLEVRPTTFARGVPKEEHNGLFGIEEKLLAMPIGTRFTAVVTYELKDDISKRGDGVRYPVVSIDHIEPVWDEDLIVEAKAVQEKAYKERTGVDQLDFDGIEDEGEH